MDLVPLGPPTPEAKDLPLHLPGERRLQKHHPMTAQANHFQIKFQKQRGKKYSKYPQSRNV